MTQRTGPHKRRRTMNTISKHQARVCVWLIIVVSISIATLSGHHSQSQYDLSKVISIEGTFTQLTWANPHTLFVVEVKTPNNATPQKWYVEGPSPRGLENVGWKREGTKVGDKVTITGNP